MATHAPIMGVPTRAPSILAPPSAITRVLAAFNRNQLAGFIAVAIDLIDLADGDTDLEDGHDAEAFTTLDGFRLSERLPANLTDDHEAGGDDTDASFPEWHPAYPHMRMMFGSGEALQHEDAEDDDSDRCAAGDDHIIAGAVASLDHWDPRYHGNAARIGDDADGERNEPPAYQMDQRAPLFVTAANEERS